MTKLKLVLLVVFASLIMLPVISGTVRAASITCAGGVVVEQQPGLSKDDQCAGIVTSTNASCKPKTSFLGLPTWYKYLPGEYDSDGVCVPQFKCSSATAQNPKAADNCNTQSNLDPSKLWLIGLAILELLLRLAGFIAVIMVVFGGFKYITSQGQPDATKNARGTIINAFIGLVITILATVSVNFVARLLQ